ncbi:bpX6 domain-containing protein [Archangium lansingense]|uniref:BpX6 domain-containing protein n=1 Tax=Archangium lansingense TaxID=2995310 RepID=A0ABT4AM12_9BACT|nr:bpX6 domain-containing protein [Archangium lansinium]MCY1082601.1 bpX6 domain-containing protein [Archangium lansinium]
MRPARSPRPRAHVHRGFVEAVAFWFDPALLGEAEARRRVLAAWTPGAAVYALAGGFLLRLTAPCRVECAAAPGLPLTQQDGVLLSAPLSSSEHERLAPSSGSAVLVRAGTAQVHPLEPSRRVDVSAWLDVSGWGMVPVESLGALPPPVATPVPVEAPTRARFGVGAPAPEAEVMRARLEGRPEPQLPRAPGLLERLKAWWNKKPQRPGEATVEAGTAARAAGMMEKLRAWWRGTSQQPGQAAMEAGTATRAPGLFERLLAWWSGREGGASSEGRGTSGNALPSPPPPPQGPGLFSRLAEWLATSTPLGSLLGRRKAEYVRRLFDLFDEGNLQEALRYAIPLDKGAPSEQVRVSLGLPGPREQLAIQPRQGGAASVFGGGAAVYEALRERYREAFRKLEREGRIEEAAFVLAELLNESAEAVSFLERHGRFRLAAELAEGRKLAPGLVVRQWMLAKDVARAVDIARHTGAFADAVLRLERSHPAEARVLRLLWGEVLAQSGDYARAVEVVWPVEDARRLTLAWLERGVEVGGVSGARLLARMLSAFPERFDKVRTRALALLDGEDAEGAPARQVFTEALVRAVEHDKSGGDAGHVLLRSAVRALLRDRAAGHLPLNPRELERMVQLTGDTVLRADLPPLPPPPERKGFSAEGARHVFDAAEGGPWPIYDAVPLSGGRLLVALGEAGARLVTREGRCVAHFDVPAFSLVLSMHEDRALALAPRGAVKRLSRLELAQRRAEPWCDTRVDAFARVYDGNLWFLAVEDTVMAVDALASEPRALWRVPQLGGHVLEVAAGPSELSFATFNASAELERWTYSLPGPTLRSRQALPRAVEELRYLSLRMDGELVALDQEEGQWLGAYNASSSRPPAQVLPRKELRGVVLGGLWMATMEPMPEGERVGLLERTQGTARAQFFFEEHWAVSVRFLNGELLLFDTAGRLARVDPARGEVRRVVLR